MAKNIFMLRTKPEKIERFQRFIDDEFIAIGWYKTGDLTGASTDVIREKLSSAYPNYEGQSFRTNFSMVNTFVTVMNAGDIVLVRKDGMVHIGEIKDYVWETDFIEEYMPHTRSVTWISEVPFNEFNAKIQSLLKNIRTVCRFNGTWEEAEIEQYITGEKPTATKIEDSEDLLKESLETLKYLMKNSEDETVRLEATKEILKLINK